MTIPSRYWLYEIAWIKGLDFLFDVFVRDGAIDIETDELDVS